MKRIVLLVTVVAALIVAATASADSRVNACASGMVWRAGDNSFGLSVNLTAGQLSTGKYTDAKGTAVLVMGANYIQGVGTTCDDPVALGYKLAGWNVDGTGKVNTYAGANIYPYYTK